LDCSPNWFFKEGEWLDANPICEVAYVGGKAHNVLLAERIVLNVISRCSGVATQSRNIKHKLDEMLWQGFIAGTRKTTPGFRMVEKYGLLIGGVTTHRYDLSSLIMIKDNHISISGSVRKAVAQVRSAAGFVTKIEVECRNLDEAREAAHSGADIIMLDNFKPQELEYCSKWLKANFPSILVEASGGINEDNVGLYAKPTVDIISLSSLVQGYQTVDYSMKVLTSQK
jgi:nicotinate-nucleotide pyrophosphorylase (carboxylating)